jgi:hypothetical protein
MEAQGKWFSFSWMPTHVWRNARHLGKIPPTIWRTLYYQQNNQPEHVRGVSRFALCGMPFLAGFYSKGLILELVSFSYVNLVGFFLFFISTGLTVCYSFLLFYYVFCGMHDEKGKPRGPFHVRYIKSYLHSCEELWVTIGMLGSFVDRNQLGIVFLFGIKI